MLIAVGVAGTAGSAAAASMAEAAAAPRQTLSPVPAPAVPQAPASPPGGAPAAPGARAGSATDSVVAEMTRQIAWIRAIPFIGLLLFLLLVAIIAQVMRDPFKASRWGWQALSAVFTRFTNRFAKARAEEAANVFLSRKLFPGTADAPLPQVQVQYVTKVEDPKLHKNGHLIVRIRNERNQARNTLAVIRTALPHILYPHARPYLSQPLVAGVDLEVLRLLVNALDESAQALFSTDLLAAQTKEHPSLRELLPVLHAIQRQGLFGHVLLQEFIYLSNSVRARPAHAALAKEAEEFVTWVHRIATRPPHDETTDLIFVGEEFKVAFILAARSATAAMGTMPYERRLGIHLVQGARSIYLLGLTSEQTKLCEGIAARFAEDRRVSRVRSATVESHREDGVHRVRLVHFRKNELFMPDASFAEQLSAYGIRTGEQISAEIREVADTRVALRVDTLDAWMTNRDLAWGYRGHAGRFVAAGQRLPVVVTDVDDTKHLVHVGRKQLTDSPWAAGRVPTEGARALVELVETTQEGHHVVRIVDVLAGPAKQPPKPAPATADSAGPRVERATSRPTAPRDGRGGTQAVPATDTAARPAGTAAVATVPSAAVSSDRVEDVDPPDVYGVIPGTEWSWYAPTEPQYAPPVVGRRHEAEVLIADMRRDEIILSPRRLEVQDWEGACRRYQKGTVVRATVLQVQNDGLVCQLEPGVFGHIPAFKVQRAGYELADFQRTVVPGTRYDVRVVGIRERRKDFRLELARDPVEGT